VGGPPPDLANGLVALQQTGVVLCVGARRQQRAQQRRLALAPSAVRIVNAGRPGVGAGGGDGREAREGLVEVGRGKRGAVSAWTAVQLWGLLPTTIEEMKTNNPKTASHGTRGWFSWCCRFSFPGVINCAALVRSHQYKYQYKYKARSHHHG
jgi:hypothetical protein